MIGIKEIARLAQVSPSTVSNVLNGRKNVGEETRQRVLKLCQEQDYHPNLSGKNLKTGRSDTIVFNFSDFDRSFYLKIIKGISDCLTEHGYDLIICTNKSSKNFMCSSFAGGAISLDGRMSDETLCAIAARGFPIVAMDRELSRPGIKSVLTNNYPVMCELIHELIRRGYRRFGFLGGPSQTLDTKERFGAFLDTLTQHQLPFDQTHLLHGDYREQSGYQAAKLLVLSGKLPEVLVCANDNMALGAIRALKEQGVSVPEQVAVTGFDDCDLAKPTGLTTVSIPRYESGYLAARELHAMIAGTASEQSIKLSASICWRETTK